MALSFVTTMLFFAVFCIGQGSCQRCRYCDENVSSSGIVIVKKVEKDDRGFSGRIGPRGKTESK